MNPRWFWISKLTAAVTLVPVLTLTWLGWRLLDQDRMLEELRHSKPMLSLQNVLG